MGDKIRTLSQAIRLGSTFRPQCQWSPFRIVDYINGRDVVGSCALGAAYEAVFGDKFDSCDWKDWDSLITPGKFVSDLTERFPQLTRPVIRAITNRNDVYGDTREEIADWLQSQGL